MATTFSGASVGVVGARMVVEDGFSQSLRNFNRQVGQSHGLVRTMTGTMDQYTRSVSAFSRRLEVNNRLIRQQRNELDRLGKNVHIHGQRIRRLGFAVTDLGRVWSIAVTAPLVALGVGVLSAARKFETSFAGIKKTVRSEDLEDDLKRLSKEMRELAKSIPTNVNELNRIGELAGQLGVEVPNIQSFTKVIAELAVTTNLTADNAAIMLARFANITGLPHTEFRTLGDAIVHLGNNFATTEKEILEMGLRMAGAGSIANISEGPILAIATAVSSVGIRAQKGGTAIQRSFIEMSQAVAKGGDSLDLLGKVSSRSLTPMIEDGREFAAVWKQDASVAFREFVEGLGQSGDEAFDIIAQFVGKNQRFIDTFLRLSKAGDLLANALDEVSEAQAALLTEAEKRYATFDSQLTLFFNKLNDVGITAGTALFPVLLKLLEIMEPLVNHLARLADGFSKTPAPIRSLVAAGFALIAVIGPLAYGLGLLTQAIGGMLPVLTLHVVPAIIHYTKKTLGMATATRAATAATVASQAGFARLGTVLAGLGVLAIGTAFLSVTSALSKLREEATRFIEEVADSTSKIPIEIRKTARAIASNEFYTQGARIREVVKGIAEAERDMVEADSKLSVSQANLADARQKFHNVIADGNINFIALGKAVLDNAAITDKAATVAAGANNVYNSLKQQLEALKNAQLSAVVGQQQLNLELEKSKFVGVDPDILEKTRDAVDDVIQLLDANKLDAAAGTIGDAASNAAVMAKALALGFKETELANEHMIAFVKTIIDAEQEIERLELKASRVTLEVGKAADRLKKAFQLEADIKKLKEDIQEAFQLQLIGEGLDVSIQRFMDSLKPDDATLEGWREINGLMVPNAENAEEAAERIRDALSRAFTGSIRDFRIGMFALAESTGSKFAAELGRLSGVVDMLKLIGGRPGQIGGDLQGVLEGFGLLTEAMRTGGIESLGITDKMEGMSLGIRAASASIINLAESAGLVSDKTAEAARMLAAVGAAIGEAFGDEQGAAIGQSVGTLAGLLGLGQGRDAGPILSAAAAGAQLAGPWGAVAGAVIGWASTLKKAAQTFADGSTTMGLLSAQIHEGSGELLEKTQQLTNGIVETANGILAAIHGTFASFTRFSVQFRDDSEGLKAVVNGVQKVFGDNVQGALDWVITEIFKQTDISGVSSTVKGALDNFVGTTVKDLQDQLKDALSIDRLGLTDFELGIVDEVTELGRLLSRAINEFGAGADKVLLGPGGLVATFRSAYNQAFGIEEDQEELTRQRIASVQAQIAIAKAQLIIIQQQLLAQQQELQGRAAVLEGTLHITRGTLAAQEAGIRGSIAFAEGVAATASVTSLSAIAIAEALAGVGEALAALEGFDFSQGAINDALARARRAAGDVPSGGGGSTGVTDAERAAEQFADIMKGVAETLLAAGETDWATQARHIREAYAEQASQLEELAQQGYITSEQLAQSLQELAEALGITLQQLGAVQLGDMMAGWAEIVQAAGETDFETQMRHLQEGFEDQAKVLREMLAAGAITWEQYAAAMLLLGEAAGMAAGQLEAAFRQGQFDNLVSTFAGLGSALASNYQWSLEYTQALADLAQAVADGVVSAEHAAVATQQIADQAFVDFGTSLLAFIDQWDSSVVVSNEMRQRLQDLQWNVELARLEYELNFLYQLGFLAQDVFEEFLGYLGEIRDVGPPAFRQVAAAINTVANGLRALRVVDWAAWARAVAGISPAGSATPQSVGAQMAAFLDELGLLPGGSNSAGNSIQDQFRFLLPFFEAFGIDIEQVRDAMNQLGDAIDDWLAKIIERSKSIVDELRGIQSTPGQTFSQVFGDATSSSLIARLLAGDKTLTEDELNAIVDLQEALFGAGQDAFGGIGVGFSSAAALIEQIYEALAALDFTPGDDELMDSYNAFTQSINGIGLNDTIHDSKRSQEAVALLQGVGAVRNEVTLLRDTQTGTNNELQSIRVLLSRTKPKGGII